MKNFLLLLSLFTGIYAHAQYPKSNIDTTAKFTLTEVIKVDSLNRFELYKKAGKWIENQKFEVIEEDPIEGKFIARNKIIVYTDKSVLAKPNGDFHHDVLIEIKDGKYRYSFTNFVYRQYKLDRNLKYVPVKGKKPIEDTKAPGWSKQWSKNKLQVNNQVNEYIHSLKEAMKYVHPKPVITEKPKDEW